MKYFKDQNGNPWEFTDHATQQQINKISDSQGMVLTTITKSEFDILTAPTPAQELELFISKIMVELDKTDLVAIRCIKAGVTFPIEWKTYTTDLRALLGSTTAGSLPTQPAYPAGT